MTTAEDTRDAPPTRFVFVHYHILKNGGSTIESILHREFGERFANFHGPTRDSILDRRDLVRYVRQRLDISAISSHHLRYPRGRARGMVFFDCCFLRHPLDRLISLYNYFRRIDSPDPLCCQARRQSLKEFIAQLLHESPHIVSNVQVTQLACAGAFARPANERDLQRSGQVVCDMAVPGVVEMFDESLVAAEYFLRPAFPHLRLDYVPQNVSPQNVNRPAIGQPELLNKLEDRLVGLWGADIQADLVRLNQLDLELFRRAQSEIRRRLFLVPGLDQKLADFKARCVRRCTQAGSPPQREPMTFSAAG